MVKWDDEFDDAEAKLAARKTAEDRKTLEADIYGKQVLSLVETLVQAAKEKAEEFRDHPKNTNKPAVIGGGTQLTVRRPSNLRMPERRLQISFRQDL